MKRMTVQGNLLSKTLVIGIIFLLIGLIVQTSTAIIPMEKNLESNTNQKDAKWLGSMEGTFGNEIDVKFDFPWKRYLPVGNYYINLKLNFRCPLNRKIIIHYHVKAELLGLHEGIEFFDFGYRVTIINGSNPPDIDENYVEKMWTGFWGESLQFNARLEVFEFIDGEWVLIDEDNVTKEDSHGVVFYAGSEFFYELLNILYIPFSIIYNSIFLLIDIINRIADRIVEIIYSLQGIKNTIFLK